VTTKAWRVWCVWFVVWTTYVIANIVWDLVWFYRWPEFYALLVAVNCGSLALLWFTHRRMRVLHRRQVTKEEQLQRRYDHAVERSDWDDICFTHTLMKIWNVKPQRPVPSAPDGQGEGGPSS